MPHSVDHDLAIVHMVYILALYVLFFLQNCSVQSTPMRFAEYRLLQVRRHLSHYEQIIAP